MSANRPSADDPAIAVDQLTVTRGGRTVLAGVSVGVGAGTVTGLIGPSGSGKTTLLRSIVGVQLHTSGSVTILGLAAGSAALRRKIGYMTQAPSVYGDLTVAENLDYFAHVLGAGASRIDAVTDAVALGGHRPQLVRDLSGGERARVSLATALLNDPPVLVLDEPTVGQDPRLRRDLWAVFHRLAAAGTTILVSSHVMDEAGRCDDLLLLSEGRLIYHGSPRNLLVDTGAGDLDAAFLALVEP